jgi:hypothetical protein
VRGFAHDRSARTDEIAEHYFDSGRTLIAAGLTRHNDVRRDGGWHAAQDDHAGQSPAVKLLKVRVRSVDGRDDSKDERGEEQERGRMRDDVQSPVLRPCIHCRQVREESACERLEQAQSTDEPERTVSQGKRQARDEEDDGDEHVLDRVLPCKKERQIGQHRPSARARESKGGPQP